MKLGSLFDGSGTAPLAAAMCGIEPVWASEIEPYPIKVTKARFPNMLHLGDITKINGAEVEPVDIICGGSPCQDLSVAGKQKGLQDGERSHMFYEMTRIIKEMREATDGKYPKYIIWKNVPGAFSSNNGRDFLAVLRAFSEIADPNVYVPEPPHKGKTDRLAWRYAGSIVGDGWSVAWRTVDAKYWGVPQRRRRIYLVADLADGCAGEILFEREGLPGHPEPSGTQRESTAEDAGRSVEGSNNDVIGHAVVYTADCRNGALNEELSGTLQAKPNGWFSLNYINPVVYPGVGITSKQNQSNPQPGDACCTLDTDSRKYLVSAVCIGNGQLNQISMAEQSNCLDCMHDKQAILTNGKPPRKYIVRRLTPLECCRLQGFPDWWEDGVEGSDSARYKMWGNGMALPNMLHVMRGIVREEGER